MSIDTSSTLPLISIIIPVYNRPESLKRTLSSVIRQTYTNIEVHVVDDGSDVEISPIIEELIDNRFFYHKLEHKNANVARNYGIKKSKGLYIAMLDSDDLWVENHIEECLNTILENKADGLYGSLILRNITANEQRPVIVRPLFNSETMIDYLLSTGYGAQTSTLFMTADSVKTILWNYSLNRHQDYDFIIRYSKQFKLIAKKNPTVIYLIDEEKNSNIDFQSCIQVIEDNKKDISPNIYSNYHVGMLKLSLTQNAPGSIIRYYQDKVTCYKEFISYHQFNLLKSPKTKLERLKYKLEYILYMLKI